MESPIAMHRRRSIRYPGFNYASVGVYFVTMCTYEKRRVFGEIAHGEMSLNEVGRIVQLAWGELSSHFKAVETDAFVIMPNHVHGIIWIRDVVGAGFPRPGAETAPLPKLGSILAFFKYQSAKRINALIRRAPACRLWQRNYYEHVLRSEQDLFMTRKYILENPMRWEQDKEHEIRQIGAGQYSHHYS